MRSTPTLPSSPRGLPFGIATLAAGAVTVGLMQGCGRGRDERAASPSILRLATTTSTQQSGLLGELLPRFERLHRIRVEVAAKGSGAALQLAREGQADVVLVHARGAEDQFVREGYGVNRRDVMYNDFVILGPPSDPATISATRDVARAFRGIALKEAKFLSRGDNSGTHMRELQLWDIAGLNARGGWYGTSGTGMLETLKMASEQGAYVLSDRSTYLTGRDELDLIVLVEGDKRLHNPYGVIAVNPEKVAGANFAGAMAFVDFLTSTEARAVIDSYGKARFGRPLFTTVAQRM